MSVYHDVLKKLDKVDRDTYAQAGTFGPKQKHTPRYQRYFEGWTSRESVLPNGRIVRERLYVGPYFAPDLPAAARRRRKGLSALLALLGLGLMIFAVWLSRGAGNCFYVYLPQTLSLIAYVLLLWYTGTKLFQPARLTISDYRETARGLLLCALLLTVVLGLTAVCSALHALLNGMPGNEGLAALATLLSALAGAAVFRMELRTAYKALPNENAPEP